MAELSAHADTGPATLGTAMGEIHEAITHGSFERAIIGCDRLLLEHPHAVRVLRARAHGLERMGDIGRALDDYRRVLDVVPTDHRAMLGTARCLAQLGETSDAAAMALQALDYDPNSPGARGLLDAVQNQAEPAGRVEDARAMFKAGLRPRAVRALRKQLLGAPDRSDLQLVLAELLWHSGERIAAAEQCQAVLYSLPDCLPAHALLANLWDTARAPQLVQYHADALNRVDPDGAETREWQLQFGLPEPIDSASLTTNPRDVAAVQPDTPAAGDAPADAEPASGLAPSTPGEPNQEQEAWIESLMAARATDGSESVDGDVVPVQPLDWRPLTDRSVNPEAADERPAWLASIGRHADADLAEDEPARHGDAARIERAEALAGQDEPPSRADQHVPIADETAIDGPPATLSEDADLVPTAEEADAPDQTGTSQGAVADSAQAGPRSDLAGDAPGANPEPQLVEPSEPGQLEPAADRIWQAEPAEEAEPEQTMPEALAAAAPAEVVTAVADRLEQAVAEPDSSPSADTASSVGKSPAAMPADGLAEHSDSVGLQEAPAGSAAQPEDEQDLAVETPQPEEAQPAWTAVAPAAPPDFAPADTAEQDDAAAPGEAEPVDAKQLAADVEVAAYGSEPIHAPPPQADSAEGFAATEALASSMDGSAGQAGAPAEPGPARDRKPTAADEAAPSVIRKRKKARGTREAAKARAADPAPKGPSVPVAPAPEAPPASTAASPAGLLAAARRALKSNDAAAAANAYRRMLKSSDSVKDVIADLSAAVARHEDAPELNRVLGDALMRDGSTDKALAAYEAGLRKARQRSARGPASRTR